MTEQGRLPVNTAINKEQSIWRDVERDFFRRHIVDLQRAADEVPSDPIVHSASHWLASHTKENDEKRILPFHVEQRLADDLAFLAAAEEGPKEVSAVALEEQYGPRGLIVLLAANERIPPGVEDAMKGMFDLLSQCASRKLSRHTCTQSLFELVIGPNQNRIHGRFQSVHWDKPKSRIHTKEPEPLYGWLRKVVRQLEQRRSKDPVGSAILIQRIRHLCDFLQRIDQLKKGNAKCMLLLKEIVKESYHLCTLDGNLTLDETIAHHGFAPYEITLNKHIRQVDKIGRYWGLCLSMTEDSRRYAGLFTNVKLKTLRPYEGATSHIALIQGQRARCLVHAEMQIIVFYGNSANTATLKPRIIGASKSACYLCNLFNVHHGQYFITKTHGHLYERWNFPDLAKYGPRERDEYRRVLTAMDTELQAATIRERNAKRRRQPPMGSWLTLPRIHQYSPVPSTVLSSQQDVSKPLTPQAPTPTQTTPPHSPSYPTAEVTMDNTPPTSSPPRQPDSRSTLLPMPPSPPPAYTANQHNANAPRVSLPEPQRPDVPPATHPLGLSSSSSIESWEYPVQRTITAATPFLKKSGKVPIAFEIEEPALGSITIADSTNSTSRLPINISALKEGETLSFSRKDEDDCVVLELQNPNGKTTQLTLRWLWNEQTEREH